MATRPRKGCNSPGAAIIPVNAVKTTSDITRGFMSARKSETVGSNAALVKPTLLSTPEADISLQPPDRPSFFVRTEGETFTSPSAFVSDVTVS
jgi:hypothetical protein